MTNRIIDISEEPAELSMRTGLLVIRRDTGETTVPLADIAVLIVSHPAVRFTLASLSSLCAAGGVFVVCNEKRLPSGMLLPLEGHYVQSERFQAQAEASEPMRKGLWKQVVKAKVTAQGRALATVRGSDTGLFAMAKKVRSGDTTNIEAQASRRYWTTLFGEGFERDFEALDQNRLLNYGYAVLRGITARAVCAAGLHPTLGLHHHNRYNPFCLADDLMEPYRPVVDKAVFEIVQRDGKDAPLDKNTKNTLVRALSGGRFQLDGEMRTLFDLSARTATSLAGVYAGERKSLVIPET